MLGVLICIKKMRKKGERFTRRIAARSASPRAACPLRALYRISFPPGPIMSISTNRLPVCAWLL